MDELAELNPLPSGVPEKLERLPDIRAVLFDIYGTLLVSDSGDIGGRHLAARKVRLAFKNYGLGIFEEDSNESFMLLISMYIDTIKEIHCEQRRNGVPHPETDILRVWEKVLGILHSEKAIASLPDQRQIRKIAFLFEIASNPVFPMPGMRDVIMALEKAGLLLGIISNAQFYTPLIMNYFIDGEIMEGDEISGFSPEFCFFSHKFLRAKPDLFLFDAMASKLMSARIPPGSVLYIGNDMLKDMTPAQRVGFKTALFAGDANSLRMRDGLPAVRGVTPDCVINRLESILEIIGLERSVGAT